MSNLTRYEMETVINYNKEEEDATVYTRDPVVMRKLDKLCEEFPEHYKRIEETEVDKTYSMKKTLVSYRKPRVLTDEDREMLRERFSKAKMPTE